MMKTGVAHTFLSPFHMPTVYFQHKRAVYDNNVTSLSDVIFLLGYYENFLSAFLTFSDVWHDALDGEVGPSQGLHRTTQHRKTWTHIHASSGMRTHDSNFRAAKTHALRHRGHCNRQILLSRKLKYGLL
jgi:hypothetical protein